MGCLENFEFEINIPIFHHFYPVKFFSISLGPWKWHKPGTIKRFLISINCRISETLAADMNDLGSTHQDRLFL